MSIGGGAKASTKSTKESEDREIRRQQAIAEQERQDRIRAEASTTRGTEQVAGTSREQQAIASIEQQIAKGSEQQTTRGTQQATTAGTRTSSSQLKLEQPAIDRIIEDVLSGPQGLANIFQGEQTAGIFGSSVSAQAAGDLTAKLVGEIARITGETVTRDTTDETTRGITDSTTDVVTQNVVDLTKAGTVDTTRDDTSTATTDSTTGAISRDITDIDRTQTTEELTQEERDRRIRENAAEVEVSGKFGF